MSEVKLIFDSGPKAEVRLRKPEGNFGACPAKFEYIAKIKFKQQRCENISRQ